MSTVALRQQSRLKIGGKKSNRFRKEKRPEGAPSRLATSAAAVGALLRGLLVLGLLLGVLASLGVGLLYGYRFLTTCPYFALHDIQVTGNSRLGYGQILDLAGVELNRNALEINVAEIERTLSQNPWVAQASVRRELPDRLFIRIRERQPMFWVQNEGKLSYTDASGALITAVEPGQFLSLPLLQIDPETLGVQKCLASLTALLGSHDLPFGLGQIAWIRLGPAGEVEMYLDAEGFSVSFSLADWRTDLTRIAAIWQELKTRGELPQVRSIAAAEGLICVEKKTSRPS